MGDADGSSASSSNQDEQRFPFMDSDGHERKLSMCSLKASLRALQHDGKQLGENAIFYSAQSLQNYSLCYKCLGNVSGKYMSGMLLELK